MFQSFTHLLADGQRTSPKARRTSRSSPSPSSSPTGTKSSPAPAVLTMSLNAEPADPSERLERHTSPKSYADAAEQPRPSTPDIPFDESTIKETPPTTPDPRNGGRPRTLGEVIHESERISPTLRHPKGRLEVEASRETYADAVKENAPFIDQGADKENTPPNVINGLQSIVDPGKEKVLNTDPTDGRRVSSIRTPSSLSDRSGLEAVKEEDDVPLLDEAIDDQSKPRDAGTTASYSVKDAAIAEEVVAPSASEAESEAKDAGTTAAYSMEDRAVTEEVPIVSKDAADVANIDVQGIQAEATTAPATSRQNVDTTAAYSVEDDAVTEEVGAADTAALEGGGNTPDASVKHTERLEQDRPKTPEIDTLIGMGEDETPRSPTRRTHKKSSSRSLNSIGRQNNREVLPPSPPQSQKDEHETSPLLSPNHSVITDSVVTDADGQGTAIYQNIHNKSGEDLTSLKPAEGFYMSLAQRENKPTNDISTRARSNSELVSGREAGANWSRSAIRFAPFNVPLQRRLQTAVVLFHTLSIAGGLAFFFLACTFPILWPILLPYLIYVLFSRAAISGELSQRSEWCRNLKIWSLFASYFPARLHRSEILEPTRKYIFGYHPHGIISHGAFAAFATEALGFSQLFPGITNTLLTLDSNFRIPFYRDYALKMGLASVSRESCENILSKGGPNNEGMGRGIVIVVGGARESLDARPFSLRLVLKRRKGFVKLAIRTGADLVPTLAFGENDIYDQLDTEQHPHVHKMQMLVKRVMGFTVPLFHARGTRTAFPL